jgi:beta-phosphoglucomutase-like phosphatase (HAD superfamily)
LGLKALLLDLDKTLVNVEDHVDYCAGLEAAKTAAGRVRRETHAPPTTWGRCTRQAMQLLLDLADDPDRWDLAAAAIDQYEIAGATLSTPMPGLARFVQFLEGRRAAVVTLLGKPATDVALDLHGIRPDVVVPRARALRPKPHRDQVDEALRRLDVGPTQAVMVGDASWDAAAALAAGVDFVGLRNARSDPGFDPTVRVVEDLDEVRLLLDSA